MNLAVAANGTVQAALLYGPYGGVRYSSGTMPTAKGFTGQRADAATSGLDYYNARYYDPVAGQFISADSIKGGQGPNRYGYVAGNPTTRTDPTGQRCDSDGCGGGGTGGGGSSGGSNGGGDGCYSDSNCGACYTGSCGVPPPPPPPGGSLQPISKKVLSSGDPTSPLAILLGTLNNGGLELIYSGKSLQALITAFNTILSDRQRDCTTGPCYWLNKTIEGLLTMGFALAGIPFGAAGVGAGTFLGFMASSAVDWATGVSLQQLQDYITMLTNIHDAGGQAIYVTTWQGDKITFTNLPGWSSQAASLFQGGLVGWALLQNPFTDENLATTFVQQTMIAQCLSNPWNAQACSL